MTTKKNNDPETPNENSTSRNATHNPAPEIERGEPEVQNPAPEVERDSPEVVNHTATGEAFEGTQGGVLKKKQLREKIGCFFSLGHLELETLHIHHGIQGDATDGKGVICKSDVDGVIHHTR
ncbi:hypothetical protein POM88_025192 [Heracleum sosnowskyi]|uniref:Uncharacterized protein n=1 Tax=Heracleum sosnowskyi TaxID=360622 RepID=A0AAD8I5X5_9APIA|nr:hypothetical protein POM88_025192 [Heracleum sosnowskyi]